MPLHRAAKAGDADRVTSLLVSGHDPSAKDEQVRWNGSLCAAYSACRMLRIIDINWNRLNSMLMLIVLCMQGRTPYALSAGGS